MLNPNFRLFTSNTDEYPYIKGSINQNQFFGCIDFDSFSVIENGEALDSNEGVIRFKINLTDSEMTKIRLAYENPNPQYLSQICPRILDEMKKRTGKYNLKY